MIIGIVAVDNNWGIGKDNKLLFHIKEDMQFFKQMTTGHIVCMGHNTYRSLPKFPLENRINVVLTSTAEINDCITLHSLNDVLDYYNTTNNDLYIIGGSILYNQMLPYYDKVYVTKVFADKDADTYFPNLDSNIEFIISNKSDIIKNDIYTFQFLTYERKLKDED